MLEQVTWFAHTHHQSPQSRVASVFAHGRRTGPVRVQQDHLRRRGRQAHSDVDTRQKGQIFRFMLQY